MSKTELDSARWRMKHDLYTNDDEGALIKYNDYKLIADAYIDLMDASIDKKLIDACNFICEYVEGNIEDEWAINLTMNSIESSIELEDYSGDAVDCDHDDGMIAIRAMCNLSIMER